MNEVSEGVLGNNRRDLRQPMSLRVEYVGEDFPPAWTVDVSAGGLRLRGSAVARTGEAVRLRLSFPSLLAPIEVRGEVVWTQSFGEPHQGRLGVRVSSARDRRRLEEIAGLSVARGPLSRMSTYRVVVVDAEPVSALTHRIAVEGLSGVGPLVVEVVDSWAEALTVLEDGSVDMLVACVSAIRPDAALVLDYARHNPELRDTTILAIGSGDPVTDERTADLLADALLPPHVQVAQLLETIAGLLGHRSARQVHMAYV